MLTLRLTVIGFTLAVLSCGQPSAPVAQDGGTPSPTRFKDIIGPGAGLTKVTHDTVTMTGNGTNAVPLVSTGTFPNGVRLDTSTSDGAAPELDWIAHNADWVEGIDVANTPPARDFVSVARRGSYSFEDGVCNGTTTLTSAAQGGFSSVLVGKAISGTNIVGGTTITAVASATSLTLSNTCTTGTSLRFTVTDASTYDIMYWKHRGSLAPTVGFGVTPPDGSYRMQVAASDSEPAMGTISARVGPSQTGPAIAVRDSTPNTQWMVDSDFMMASPQGSHVSIKGVDSNNNPLDLYNTAKTNALGFWIGSNFVHNFTSWVMGNGFTATYNLEGDSSGNLYALHNMGVDGTLDATGACTLHSTLDSKGVATIEPTLVDTAGIQDSLIVGSSVGIAHTGDGMALHFSNTPATNNYNTRIASVNTAASPSFLNPKLIFQVQAANTSGVGSLVTLFEITNTGPVCDNALDMTTHLIHNVVDPVSAQDAATKNYVDTHSSGGSTTPTVSFAVSNAPPATVNVSTEGTIDWIYIGTLNSLGTSGAWLSSPGSIHSKINGGRLYKTLQGLPPTSGTATAAQSTVAGVAYSTTASDDQTGAAISGGTQYNTLFTSSNGLVGFGHLVRVDARPTQQVMRWYGTFFGTATSTWTVTVFYRESGNTFTQTFTQANTQQNKLITITFTGGIPGEDVTVSVVVTAAPSTTASTAVAAITIAPT